MARRGGELRDHILWTAKDVFLEMGFERASMDAVAQRAETSKRTLYARFESKERLFLEVIALVRGLFLARLRTPADHAGEPREALVLFCGRYLEALLYEPSIQLCRVSMAETARFPAGAAGHFDVVFGQVEERLGAYLSGVFGLSGAAAAEAAQGLLGAILYPRLPRALFGLDPLLPGFSDGPVPDLDLEPVRRAVAALLATLPEPRAAEGP